MSGSKTEFEKYVEEQVQKIKGVYFPVKTNFLTRLLTKKAACKSLYPNPEDEFSMPDIGPNYNIITAYENEFRENMQRGLPDYGRHEPIIVERLHPDGCMIINGHHRWAAAMRLGKAKIPVKIVNLMHAAELREILENSRHEKRAAFDLDEVLIRAEGDPFLEEPLPFPWKYIYKERIRRGVPALFHALERSGYDVWLYSSQYHSADAVLDYFRRYHVKVAGVVSASGRKIFQRVNDMKVEKLIREKYRQTLHIDNDMVLLTRNDVKEPQEFDLSGAPETWSQEIMDVIEKIEKEEAGWPT